MENHSQQIDFVIPWVDGGDPEWRKVKNQYNPNLSEDARDIRFRDWDLLRYWFRGVEQYAPWVHKIHFITWGHLPSWLDVNHPKLNIVNHKDYIPEQYLPTFSSHVIELNMHRIKGLSENFVYFNDDMFILKNIEEKDFFVDDLPCDCLVESAITPRIGEFSSILCENVGVINKHFEKKDLRNQGIQKFFNPKYKELLIRTISTMPYHHIMGFYNPHICQSFRKDTFDEVWNEEYTILDETCKHKFRGQNDVSQYLFRYWNLAKGEFVPKYPIGKLYNVREHTEQICNAIENHSFKILTINDADCVDNIEEKQGMIHKAFEKAFPVASSFELK